MDVHICMCTCMFFHGLKYFAFDALLKFADAPEYLLRCDCLDFKLSLSAFSQGAFPESWLGFPSAELASLQNLAVRSGNLGAKGWSTRSLAPFLLFVWLTMMCHLALFLLFVPQWYGDENWQSGFQIYLSHSLVGPWLRTHQSLPPKGRRIRGTAEYHTGGIQHLADGWQNEERLSYLQLYRVFWFSNSFLFLIPISSPLPPADLSSTFCPLGNLLSSVLSDPSFASFKKSLKVIHWKWMLCWNYFQGSYHKCVNWFFWDFLEIARWESRNLHCSAFDPDPQVNFGAIGIFA